MPVPRLSSDDQSAFRHLPTEKDALLDGVLDDVGTADNPGNPLSMYRKVRSEGRDSQWAAKTEEILGKQISQVPYLDPKRPTRVICGTTICEVAGVISADTSIPNMNVAMAQLQSTTMLEFSDKNGFDPDRMSIVFGIAKSNPEGNTFVRYFVRRTPGYDPGRSGQARNGRDGIE